MRTDRLPLSYAECRERFRLAARLAGTATESHEIEERGPDGAELFVDVARIGSADASSVLLLLSGVHGVEGFVCSTLQCELLEQLGSEPVRLPDGVAVVFVHAVNPWGMAWWRRQNESNVDLNRNWGRSDIEPHPNDPYDEIHDIACPDDDEMPSVDALLVTALEMVAEKGERWIKDAITGGQYTHPDGLHFGGDRTEESNRILESIADQHLLNLDSLLVVDLHTGHGPSGELTHLSKYPPNSEGDSFLRAAFGDAAIHATVGNPQTQTGEKVGQIAGGMLRRADPRNGYCTTIEFGTASDEEQLAATYHEQWVYRHGDRTVDAHADAIWAYRCCFTPDDAQWESASLAAGREHLASAVSAIVEMDH
ncbi:MAG: DUF2817 domain-containing protein [Microthrixaceae bacterium]